MVDSTPNNPVFEGNYPSKTETLFFEFAFEPTPLSFTPQPDLVTIAPLAKAKRKRFFFNASKLAFGLLITALLMSSGILNNKLFLGGTGNQASLGWIPSWSEDATVKSNNEASTMTISTESGTAKVDETKLITTNQEEVSFATETETGLTPTDEIEPVTDLTTPTEVVEAEPKIVSNETTPPKKRAPRPFIKQPVTKAGIKLSNPAVKEETSVSKKLEITSEAFHEVNAKSALDGKKVFIKFGARWCLPCKIMESNVFPDPEIRQLLNENYHVLDVDVDNIDGINLRQMYKVEALPSFIILDNNQNIVGKYEGAKRIEELRAILAPVNP